MAHGDDDGDVEDVTSPTYTAMLCLVLHRKQLGREVMGPVL